MSCVEKLTDIQQKNKSMICLGLDLDPKRMPAEFTKSNKSMYEYAMAMIEATKDYVCAYKPNMAFYENRGPDGLSLLRSINSRIPDDIPIIVDGKRGDIGNTASHYAEALFDIYRADWVTLNPYMGYDTIRPFLEYKDKGVFILCVTSNSGSKDFQHLDVNGKPLFKVVAEKVDYWNKENNCGLVVGATHPQELKEVREISGSMPLLIPGVGAQGGSLEKAVIYGTENFTKPAVINVSRSVLYASTGPDFAEKAVEELKRLNGIVAKIRSGEITLDSLDKEEAAQPEPTEEAKTTVVVHEMPKPKTDPPYQPKEEMKETPSTPQPETPPTPQPETPPTPQPEPEPPKPTMPTPPEPLQPPPVPPVPPAPPIPQTSPTPPTQEQEKTEATEERKPEVIDRSVVNNISGDSKPEEKEEAKEEPKPTEKAEEKEEGAPKPTMPKPPPLPKPPPVLPPRPDLMNKRREERRNNDDQRDNRDNREHRDNRDYRNNRSDDRNRSQNYNRDNNRDHNRDHNRDQNRDHNRNNRDQNNRNFRNNRDNRRFNQNENNRHQRGDNN